MPPRRVEAVIRSGRFKLPAANAAVTIIHGRTSAAKFRPIYRISNTGDKPLELSGNPGGPTTVLPDCSLDCGAVASVTVKNTAAGEDIEGIYDSNLLSPEVRSGKFKLPGGGPATAKIILLDKATVQTTTPAYRIYNTGSLPFDVVYEGNAALPVAADSSVDIELKGMAGNAPSEVSVSAGGLPIEGIYELLSHKD